MVNRLANVVNLPLVNTGQRFCHKLCYNIIHKIARYRPDAGVGDLLVADVAGLLQLLVHGLDVLVEVGDGERLAAVGTLRALVVVHLADVPRQVGHRELLVTVRTLLLDLDW